MYICNADVLLPHVTYYCHNVSCTWKADTCSSLTFSDQRYVIIIVVYIVRSLYLWKFAGISREIKIVIYFHWSGMSASVCGCCLRVVMYLDASYMETVGFDTAKFFIQDGLVLELVVIKKTFVYGVIITWCF